MEPEKIPAGVVHGRFQPPHNGHLRYILAALNRAEHVTIGICSPTLCSEEEAARTGYPCTAEQNPYSHDERVEMLRAALSAENIAPERYSFVSFPSDYSNIDALVPKDAILFMSVTGEADEDKIAYLESLGWRTETVYSVPETAIRESSGRVRGALAAGDDEWAKSVPPAVADFLKKRATIEEHDNRN